jgi:pimeloyl-ACP methyl ester carboxylesterase
MLEHPVFFEAGGEQLFGIVTTTSGSSGSTSVVVLGGGKTASTVTGRNSIFAKIARASAQMGFSAVRFDYHGVGDSTGQAHQSLERPAVRDLIGAAGVLRSTKEDRLVLIGSCFGARTALAGASHLANVDGIIMLSPPIRDYASAERRTEGWSARDYARALVRPRTLLGGSSPVTFRRYVSYLRTGARVGYRRLRSSLSRRRNPTPWVSSSFVESLRSAAASGIRFLFVYGVDDENLQDLEAARAGELGNVLDGFRDSVEVRVIPGRVHGFATIELQERVISIVSDQLMLWRKAGP